MYCMDCGRYNCDDNRRCRYCKYEFVSDFCEYCGAVLGYRSEICSKCGAPVKHSQSAYEMRKSTCDKIEDHGASVFKTAFLTFIFPPLVPILALAWKDKRPNHLKASIIGASLSISFGASIMLLALIVS